MKTTINRHATEKRSQQRASSIAAGPLLQRKCACGGSPGPSGECEKCREKRLQQKVGDKQSEMQNHSSIPPIVHEVLRSSGQPLNSSVRDFMEKRFDHDFSGVRVHADANAGESAQTVGADAYTVGSQIIFAPGRYAPASAEGQALVAHELAHVIQQETSNASKPAGESSSFEHEAQTAAAQVPTGPVHVNLSRTGLNLAKAPKPAGAARRPRRIRLKRRVPRHSPVSFWPAIGLVGSGHHRPWRHQPGRLRLHP